MQPSDFDLENGTLLGCGAIAYVNRAKHIATGNHFAVKSVSKIQALQQNKTEGLRLEKKVLRDLSFYPGVVHLFGTMQSADEIYFVMEMLSRGDLQEHIKRIAGVRRSEGAPGHCLRRRDAQSILIQIVLTLQLMWQRGIVLRDAKPENVGFHSNGRAVIFDFDTVLVDAPKLFANDNDQAPNAPGTSSQQQQQLRVSQVQNLRRKSQQFCGTAQFVSPETLASCDWTFASDLFAVGAVLYFMLAGRPLFDGDSAFEVMQQIRAGVAAVKSEQMAPGVRACDGAESMIRTLLSEDPRRRFCRRRGGDDACRELEFDIAAFRQHPFFVGAEDLWAKFEAEDALFRSKERGTASRDEADETPATLLARLKSTSSTPCASLCTGTSTTAVAYIDEPQHDDEYAQYALRAGSSDVERWWLDAVERAEKAAAGIAEPEAEGEAEAAASEVVGAAPAAAAIAAQNEAGDEEDDVMDIVDDVGQQQFIANAFGKDADGDATS